MRDPGVNLPLGGRSFRWTNKWTALKEWNSEFDRGWASHLSLLTQYLRYGSYYFRVAIAGSLIL